MKHMICLKDVKSRTWQPPACYDSLDAAKREAHRAVTLGRDMRDGQKPLIAMYPDDFELWHVANFDEVDGRVVAIDAAVCICNLGDLIKE